MYCGAVLSMSVASLLVWNVESVEWCRTNDLNSPESEDDGNIDSNRVFWKSAAMVSVREYRPTNKPNECSVEKTQGIVRKGEELSKLSSAPQLDGGTPLVPVNVTQANLEQIRDERSSVPFRWPHRTSELSSSLQPRGTS